MGLAGGLATNGQLSGGGGGSGTVTSVTAGSGKITVATGTTTPVIDLGVVPESAITNLVSDLAAKAPLASPTFTGTVTVPTTVNSTDAAQKSYVDGVAAGLAIKASVQEATAAALPTNTYLLGVITITATGTLTVDGIAVALNDRVLVKNEVAAANNGIYLCTTFGTTGVAAVLTRSTDMNQASEIPGAFTFVEEGTVNDSTGWVVNGVGPYTIGTTAINWTQFSGTGDITAGVGITKTGNTLAVDQTVIAPLASPTFTTALQAANPTFTGTVALPTNSIAYAALAVDPFQVSGTLAASASRHNVAFGAAAATVNQCVSAVAIYLPISKVVTSITFGFGGTAINVPSHWFYELRDSSFNVLAQTADQTNTASGTSVLKTLSLSPGTFTTTYSGIHYLSIVIDASGQPTLLGLAVSGAISQTLLNTAPVVAFIDATHNTITTPATSPSPATPGNVTTASIPYAHCS